jgi:hypothetical protein
VRVVEDNAAVAPFLRHAPGVPEPFEYPVDLRLSDLPDTSGLRRVFEAEGWCGFQDGTDVVLEFRLDGPRTLWVARVPGAAGPIVVHPGPPLVTRRGDEIRVRNPLSYPLDQLLMMHVLPAHRGVLVHAAGVRRGAGAVLFPGRSGAGKSTISRLLAGRADLERLSDDRMVVRLTEDGASAFGTPWAGNERVAANAGGSLRGVAFLCQSPEHRLVRLDPRDALHRLLPMMSILWHDEERSTRALAAAAELFARVPAYDLHFRRDEGVYEVLAELI